MEKKTYVDTWGMSSPPSWLLLWLLHEVAECEDAAIMYDYIIYLGW